jgi:putative heme-binding domain-containing protein
VPRLDRLSLEDWVELLDQDNGWLRDMAQQVLIWENATAHADRLAQLARNASRAATRAQALATLDTLNVLSDDVLSALLGDQDARVRRIAIRIAARRVATWPSLVERLTQMASTETDAGVLLELLFALGEVPSTTPLWKLAMRADRDRFMQAAFASSLRVENIEGVVADIVAVGDTPEALPPVAFAAPVIRFLSATQNFALIARLFQHWQSFAPRDDQQRLQQWQLLAEVLERWPAAARQKQGQEVVQQVEALLLSAQRVALDVSAPVSLRAAAGRLLAVGAWNRQQAARLLAGMLQPSQPAELQVAAIDALARFPDTTVADLLLEGWRSYSPAIRARVLDSLLARPEWVERLLDAIQQNRIHVSELDAARRQQLLSYRVEVLRQRANQLLAQAQNTNRQAIVEQYQVVKTLAPDPQRGRTLFAKHCSSCHRLDDQGSAVGPDLASLADRSLDSLLVAVLDPNRAVEDKFREYIAVLQDGRQFRGILATESTNSITLLGQEGKSVDLLRSELDTLVSTGKSLMPEGVENDIPPQDLADILAYVRLQQPPPKSFAGNSPRLAHVRDDGSIRLLATECRIYGPTLVFEEQYRNLGYWGSLEDRAVWDLHVPRSGTYRVILDYACHEDTAGNRFRIDVDGQALTGTVESTGTWDQYRRKTVGRLVLKEGRCELTFRAEPPLQGYLIDLREIVLDPEDKP